MGLPVKDKKGYASEELAVRHQDCEAANGLSEPNTRTTDDRPTATQGIATTSSAWSTKLSLEKKGHCEPVNPPLAGQLGLYKECS